MRTPRFYILSFVSSIILLLAMSASGVDSVVTNSPEASNPSMQALLELQEQIRETKAAIEQNRKASEESAALNAKVADRLQALEKSVADQRSHQNLLVLLPFLGLVSLVLLVTAYFQWRGMNHLGTISSALVVGEGRGPLRVVNAGTALGPVEPSSDRLGAAVERLEARLQEMEHTAQTAQIAPTVPTPPKDPPSPTERHLAGGTVDAERRVSAPPSPVPPASMELGQSLLDQSKYEEAVVCFDKLLTENPDNPPVLVKKGQALERMHKLREALACYNRAMTLDSSITIV